VQAYPGNDGVVVSLTHKECEDMVALAAKLEDGYALHTVPERPTFINMMDCIAEFKEES
jgi:hypothetical protein